MIQLIFLLFFLGVVVFAIALRSDQGREIQRRFQEKYFYHAVFLIPPLCFGILIFSRESDPTARSYAILTLALILAGEGIVFYGIHLHKKRKKNDLGTEGGAQPSLLFFLGALIFGYSLLFGDMHSSFDCRSDTQKCEYYSSTLINRKLKLAKTYDLSEIIRINILKTHRKWRLYAYHPYEITFHGLDSSFSMPQEFSSYGDAANEMAKLQAVLAKKEASYHYEQSKPKSDIFFEIILTPIAFLYGLVLYGREKEKKKEEKKQKPVFKPLRRRRLHSSQKPPVKNDDTDV